MLQQNNHYQGSMTSCPQCSQITIAKGFFSIQSTNFCQLPLFLIQPCWQIGFWRNIWSHHPKTKSLVAAQARFGNTITPSTPPKTAEKSKNEKSYIYSCLKSARKALKSGDLFHNIHLSKFSNNSVNSMLPFNQSNIVNWYC